MITRLEEEVITTYRDALTRTMAALAAEFIQERRKKIHDAEYVGPIDKLYEEIADHAGHVADEACKQMFGDAATDILLSLDTVIEQANDPDFYDHYFELTEDEAKVDTFIKDEGKRKPAHAVVLLQMQESIHRKLSWREIKKAADVKDDVMKRLIDEQFLCETGPPTIDELNAELKAGREAAAAAGPR